MIQYLQVIKVFLRGEPDGGLDIYGSFIKIIIEKICSVRGISDYFVFIFQL